MSEHVYAKEEELVVGLFDREIIKFGEFTLKSDRKSPIYYNQRPILSINLASEPTIQEQQVAAVAIEGYAEKVAEFRPVSDHLYGIPQAATAIGACIARETGFSYLWGRVGHKDYGSHESVEGLINRNQQVLQIDDVVTNADSKLDSAKQLHEAGLLTTGFVVMFDREEGGSLALEEAGYTLSAVTTLSRAVAILESTNRIGNEQIESLHSYHEGLKEEGVASTFTHGY